ncbi:DUF5723 family protein [Paraflavitalea speifideaquila]|uniref:DUF5723 family protein n=1 Tax=Paraflavitalea speifideaquila TaxID=3076558 RepID=UPI0028E3E57E|nr:DUF5723 family protein [Paraflavitalea speifideiaquila]
MLFTHGCKLLSTSAKLSWLQIQQLHRRQRCFFNPANIADSRYKWDVNVFGIDGFVGNNQNKLKFKDITKSSFNADSLKSKLLRGDGDNLKAMARVDILGPSAMFNVGPRTAMAVTTRARIFANARGINGRLAGAVIDGGQAKDTYPLILPCPTVWSIQPVGRRSAFR